MSFTWTTLSGGLAAAHHNEIKNNADSLATDLSISNYTWTHTIASGDVILDDHIKELQSSADYLDDNNYCRSHNSTDNSTADVDHNSLADNGDNYSEDSAEDSSALGADNPTNRTSDYDIVQNPENSSAYGGEYVDYYSGLNVTVEDPHCGTFNATN